MITVDRSRCGYCGSCVAVCPTSAILLNEAFITIDENLCNRCLTCLSVCPTGALNLGQLPESSPAPEEEFDVIVVGAGPAGSMAARTAARRRLRTLLLEKRQEIGSPVRCAEGVSSQALASLIHFDEFWVCATITRAAIYTVDGTCKEARKASGGKGYILERRVFDRYLAEQAVQDGAKVLVKTAAISLKLDSQGRPCGVVTFGVNGLRRFRAPLIIGADGVESLVGRWAKMSEPLAPKDLLCCAQFLLNDVSVDSECCYYYLGESIAPGGYAWVFPKGERKANVGIGIQGDLARRPPLEYLTAFIESQPSLSQGQPVTLILGSVPVAPPLESLARPGCLLVGDAARQADPLTGGGITNAMAAGALAGEVAAAYITDGARDADLLLGYPKRWEKELGRKMRRNGRLKDRFSPSQRTTQEFVDLFSLATAGK